MVQPLRGSNQSGCAPTTNAWFSVSSIPCTGQDRYRTRLNRAFGADRFVIMRELEAEDLLGQGRTDRGKVGQPSVPAVDQFRRGYLFIGLKGRPPQRRVDPGQFFGRAARHACARAIPGRRRRRFIEFGRDGNRRDAGQAACPLARSRRRAQGSPRLSNCGLETEQDGASGSRDGSVAGLRTVRCGAAGSAPCRVYLQNDATGACAVRNCVRTHTGLERFPLNNYIGTFDGERIG